MMRSLNIIFFTFIFSYGMFSMETASALDLPVQGGPGGGPIRQTCPTNSYVQGLNASAGAWMDSIVANCAEFQSNAMKSNGKSASRIGGNGGKSTVMSCSEDRYVSGIKYGFTRDDNRPKWVDYVELTCTPLAGGVATPLCFESGDKCWDKHPDPGPYNGFGLAFRSDCPPDEAVIGFTGRSGSYVDALAAVCGPRPVDNSHLPNAHAAILLRVAKSQSDISYCIDGKDFAPNGTLKFDIFDAPKRRSPESGSLKVGADGRFHYASSSMNYANCTEAERFSRVTFVVTETDGSGRIVAQTKESELGAHWCGSPGAGPGCAPARW